jgi:hypothetical protein
LLQANCNFPGFDGPFLNPIAATFGIFCGEHNIDATDVQRCIHLNAVEIGQALNKE